MRSENINNEFDNDFETGDVFDIFGRGDASENDESLKEARELYATMGFQMEYTDNLKEKKDSRKLETVQFVELDPHKSAEITNKLISIYGEDSMQVKKWTEQLIKIQQYKEMQRKAIQKRKRQTWLMGVLCAFSVVVVFSIVFFTLNSTTYYINQGDYRYIYKKTLFGQPECYHSVASSGLIKEKSYLYYRADDDHKLYRVSTKNESVDKLSENSVSEFKIIGKNIYYINETDGNTLYRINLSGGAETKIYDKPCSKLNSDGNKLSFEQMDEQSIKTMNVKTLQVSEK